MKPIRVLLADDHTLVRAGIRSLLQDLGVEVVAEAGDGREALELVEEHQPDVVLMDIAMPGLNGLEAAARIAAELPKVRVIMLSMHANEQYALRALRSCAAGYLLKDASATELELALMTVMHGQTYLSPAILRLVTGYVQRTGDGCGSQEGLTARQREMLQLIAEGRSTQEMAQILHISVKTVETHRAQLMERLDIHDIAGLVRYAIRTGLAPLDP